MTEYRTLGEFCAATSGAEHDEAVEATLQWMVAEISKVADDRDRDGLTGPCFTAESVRALVADRADLVRRYRALANGRATHEKVDEPHASGNEPDTDTDPFGITVMHLDADEYQGRQAGWMVFLPHQCAEWSIAGSNLDGVSRTVPQTQAIADLERFIGEAQRALGALRAGQEFDEQRARG